MKNILSQISTIAKVTSIRLQSDERSFLKSLLFAWGLVFIGYGMFLFMSSFGNEQIDAHKMIYQGVMASLLILMSVLVIHGDVSQKSGSLIAWLSMIFLILTVFFGGKILLITPAILILIPISALIASFYNTIGLFLVYLSFSVLMHLDLWGFTLPAHGADHSFDKRWFWLYQIGLSLGAFVLSIFLKNWLRINAVKNDSKVKYDENEKKRMAISTLSGGIAHEINNPLAIIAASLDIMKMKNEVASTRGLDRLDNMMIQCERIQAIIAGIQLVSGNIACRNLRKIDETQMTIICSQSLVDLASREHLDPKRFADVNISHQWSCEADPVYIKMMIDHILDNAYKAANKSENKFINIFSEEDNLNTHLIIEDNGNELPPAVLSAMFDPFFTTRQVGEGLGLGLTICAAICVHFGWRLEARRRFNRTQIIISFPRK